MQLPQIIQVAVELILIYYVLGTAVSLLSQIIMESRQTRGAALEAHLRQLAGDFTSELLSLPQIKALRPVRFAHWWDVLGAGIRPKKLEKVPVDTLVDAYYDLAGLSAAGSLHQIELKSLVSKLPDSDAKQALSRWIDQGVTAVSELRARSIAHFGGVLSQAGMAFRAKARSLVILLSVFVTLLFGADSIQLARGLWANADGPITVWQASSAVAMPTRSTIDLNGVLDQIELLARRAGWQSATIPPLSASALDWLSFLASKLGGLAITATAVAQGSSFWYDLLRRLTGSAAPANPPTPEPEPAG